MRQSQAWVVNFGAVVTCASPQIVFRDYSLRESVNTYVNSSMTVRRLISIAAITFALGIFTPARPQESAPAPITDQDLVGGLKNPTRWLTFSGDYTGQRHSPLKQLTPQNVAGLVPQWIFQTDIPGLPGRGIENTPLVVDGILYVTGNNNQAWALDGRTGRPIWNYPCRLPANFIASVCCGPVNRGFAILGDRLYMGTLDSHLVALDRKTGAVIWDVEVGDLPRIAQRGSGGGGGGSNRDWRGGETSSCDDGQQPGVTVAHDESPRVSD